MHAFVEIDGDRIHLGSREYHAGLKKAIPGAYFSKRARRWTFPLNMEVCRQLRQHFGQSLVIGPRLTSWARAEIARERSQAALGANVAGEGVDTPGIAARYPVLDKVLGNRPYQRAAARFVAEGRNVLLADTPGLGKTTEAIAGIIEAGVEGPYLVAAPKTSLVPVWQREIAARLPDHNPIVVAGPRAQRNKILANAELGPKSWIIVNIEMGRTKSFWDCPTCGKSWPASDKPKSNIINCGHDPQRVRTRHQHEYPQLFDVEWGAIIMDESHRSLMRRSGIPTQTRAGAKLLSVCDDGLRIACSGTPMRGQPQRLWGTLNWLDPKAWSGFWAWCERFWDVTTDGYAGARVIGDFRENRRDAFNATLSKIMLRRTKAEVSPDLPPKAYMGSPLDPADPNSPIAIWLPMEPEQERAYLEMMETGSASLGDARIDTVGILAEMTRLKQFASCYGRMEGMQFKPALPSNKLAWIIQFLTERNIIDADEAPTGKVVIVSQFTEMLEVLYAELRRLGVPVAVLTGKVTGKRREEHIDTFNDMGSGVHVMLINTMAGGVAVTLDAADDMIFIDETHVPDDQEQAEERINNRRAEEKVAQRNYWYLKSIGTIDEAIARTNMQKDASQKLHLDGRRGIAYLREVQRHLEEVRP